ncbi:MAG TPA: hypothetical protein VNZ48_04355 [Xanthobacteraceae bacterium]|jgi:hypothetical protein|nr:hypothetical protein [Xanthobacteraceae bacterium]
MLRTMFAMTVAGLLVAAVSGTSQAVPIAPLPADLTSETGGLTPVYWHHHYWHHHYWHRHYWHRHYGHAYGHRHCWRGRWGHLHCGW